VIDSPVPWYCRAQCLLISFKAALALQPCVQRRSLEDSSEAWRAPAKFPVLPGAPGEVSRRKKYRSFLQNIRRKIRHIWRKIWIRFKVDNDFYCSVELGLVCLVCVKAHTCVPAAHPGMIKGPLCPFTCQHQANGLLDIYPDPNCNLRRGTNNTLKSSSDKLIFP
jgi:hypothetical protein